MITRRARLQIVSARMENRAFFDNSPCLSYFSALTIVFFFSLPGGITEYYNDTNNGMFSIMDLQTGRE